MVGDEEKKSVEFLLPYLSEIPIIFDVGANKGEWSDIIMQAIPECKVCFFEGNLVLVHYLMMKYDYHDNITILHNVVCNEHLKNYPFYYFTNRNNGLSSIYNNPKWDYLPKQQAMVGSLRIDDFCESNKIEYVDFIKLDIEGAEYPAFLGLLKMLQKGKIGFIQIEYSEHYRVGLNRFQPIIEYATVYGYKIYLFEGDRYVEVIDFVEDYGFRNYLITKELISDTQDWNRAFKESVAGLPKIDLALEIGCFEGKTTRYIHDNMLNPGGRVVCVDPLEDEYLTEDLDESAIKMNSELPYFKNQYLRFLRNTKGCVVNLIRKKSHEAYPELNALRFQFIYIDGDHREPAVYNDGIQCFEILKIGGYILFDDYTWSEGTKQGIDRFLFEKVHSIEIIKKDYQVLIKRIL